MTTSVVIPAFNHNDLLMMTLNCVEKQVSEVDEVIVVDDGSDPPLEVPPWVRLERIERPASHRSAAPARNACYRAASCDYVISIDSTMLFVSDAFASLKRHIANVESEISDPILLTVQFFGLKRTFTPEEIPDFDAWYAHHHDSIWKMVPENWHKPNFPQADQNLSIMRKATWEMLGGFDEEGLKSWGYENHDFILRGLKNQLLVTSFIPRASNGELLLAFHNFHEDERDGERATGEFSAKWGEPFSTEMFARKLEEARCSGS